MSSYIGRGDKANFEFNRKAILRVLKKALAKLEKK